MGRKIVLPTVFTILLILGFLPVLPDRSGSIYSIAYGFFGIGAYFQGSMGYSGSFRNLTVMDALLFVGLPLLFISIGGFIWASRGNGNKTSMEKVMPSAREERRNEIASTVSEEDFHSVKASPISISSPLLSDPPSVATNSEVNPSVDPVPALSKSPRKRTGARKRKKVDGEKEALVQEVSASSSGSSESAAGVQ